MSFIIITIKIKKIIYDHFLLNENVKKCLYYQYILVKLNIFLTMAGLLLII